MKRTLTTICAVAAFGGLIITSEAQSTVLSEDFDSLPAGTYGNAYNFSDFSSSAASSIVSPGEGGVGQAFQLTF